MPLASIPSPGQAAWRLGPPSVRAYALCVIAGILVAVVVASRRYRRSGGQPGVILDVAAWAVPFGLAGAFVHAMLLEAGHDFSHAHRLWHAATAGVAARDVQLDTSSLEDAFVKLSGRHLHEEGIPA